MTSGGTTDEDVGVTRDTPEDAVERFVVVSDDRDWIDRFAAAAGPTVDRVPSERADDIGSIRRGYPAAVVVDGEAAPDPMVPFVEARESCPDAACLLAGGAGRLDPDPGSETGPRSIVLEYLPVREPESVAAAAETAVEGRTHRGYPVPDREDDRVATARAIRAGRLDSARAFDELADATARAIGAEAATVSVLGDYRLWHVGLAGERFEEMADPIEPTVDRSRTVSTYTVLENGVHAVPDLADDPRFETASRALELGLRSYLGVPLRVDGHAVGTLSAFRSRPGSFGDGAGATLRSLAAVGEELLAAAVVADADPDRPGRATGIVDRSAEASPVGED
ncbi:GAF domain-containing protein [Halobaculum sp. WSA2]|uniref:GAF domain-containing protein n=1 Tax=Halobaculum saliterrae TaxID=2073113 RepID=A0A6B0T271_9EURY|nr:GAF domain-containing protein [Halobaculum saliterrae]MXR42702.1 GAF domain-containing protein [Halobaculum saliterrae]